VKNQIAHDMLRLMLKFNETLDAQRQERLAQFQQQRQDLVARQRAERRALNDRLEQHQRAECEQRQKRFRSGFKLRAFGIG